MNNPRRIQFTNGNVTEYVYSAEGEKLRTIYRTVVNNITVPILPLTIANTLSVDSTDYIGPFIFENNKPDKLLSSGGYCSFTASDQPVFHYYTQDHLGNNRAVVDEDGTLEQVTHYYPFGGVYDDAGLNASAQPYKYNGKELDRMHGLNTYDYGARQYNPVTARWDRMDPLCEKYYSISPYAYCVNNPIKFVDIKGFAPGDPFTNPDEAAKNFGMIYNYWSIKTNKEYNSLIYYYKGNNGKYIYSYNSPRVGDESSSIPNIYYPKNARIYGRIHTHASYDENTDNPHNGNTFSPKDIEISNKLQTIADYICTTNGTLMKYRKKNDGTHEIITFKGTQYKLPSDPLDPQNNGNTIIKIENARDNQHWYEKLFDSFNNFLQNK